MNALIETEVQNFTENTPAIVVNNQVDVSKATAVIKGIKRLMDKVKESYDPFIDKAHAAHKEAIAQRDKYLDPLKEQKKKYESAITDYTKRMESEQRERERITNEELAKIAAKEKQDLLDKASTANEWDKECLEEKAAEIKPITVDVQKKVVEQDGLVIRKTWKARVINLDALPREYMLIDQTMLNVSAKNEAIRVKGIPGVQFYQDMSTSVRS